MLCLIIYLGRTNSVLQFNLLFHVYDYFFVAKSQKHENICLLSLSLRVLVANRLKLLLIKN